MNWKRKKIDMMNIYFASNDWHKFEIRNWEIDESGEGKFQLCIDGYDKGHFHLLREAKQFAKEY